MSNPIKQHYIPKTYLKQFVINKNDFKFKSKVYCFWENDYESKIEPNGINDSKFKSENFYTIENSSTPYEFEFFFSNLVEPLYPKIINEIQKECNLSIECRRDLISWLFFNKLRNKNLRDSLNKQIYWVSNTLYRMGYGGDSIYNNDFKLMAETYSKSIHMNSIINQELLEKFDESVGIKYWTILKSNLDNRFLTNDNPGFSININMNVLDLNSINSFLTIKHEASIFFPISPNYCLRISPYLEGTEYNLNLQNQVIKFKDVDNEIIDMINKITVITKTNYLIANNKSLLEKNTEGVQSR